MSLELELVLLLENSQLLVCPHIADLICLLGVKTRDLGEHRSLGDSLVKSVQDERMNTTLRSSGVVFSGMSLVPGPIGVHSPFVGKCWGTVNVVLVECENLPVLEDCNVGGGDLVKL